MNEFDIINHYFQRDQASTAALGIGDDCALMDIPDGEQLVFSMDSLVAGVHFFAHDQADNIASRALCVALSDLAAMGAEPHCFTLALSMPSADDTWLAAFSRGLFAVADTYKCELVGGDTVRGPLQITIQVHGTVPKGHAVLRSGATEGDIICVSGPIGDGAAALHLLTSTTELPQHHRDYLTARFYQPAPRFDIGRILRSVAGAAIDISDGLVADLKHICEASDVGAVVNVEKIPQSQASLALASKEKNQYWSLYGGDDYQLCFTVSPDRFSALNTSYPEIDINVIGTIVKGAHVRCAETGMCLSAENTGYQHFGESKSIEGGLR